MGPCVFLAPCSLSLPSSARSSFVRNLCFFSRTRVRAPVAPARRARTAAAVLSDTWGSPRWLARRPPAPARSCGDVKADPAAGQPPAQTVPVPSSDDSEVDSWGALAVLVARAIRTRVQTVPKRRTVVKFAASAFLLTVVVYAWKGYALLNQTTSERLSALTETHMSRRVQVGRLRRFSFPCSLHFGKSSLLEPPSSIEETAPDVSTSSVVISLADFVPAMLRRKPLAISVTMRQPEFHVRQTVSMGPLGKPVANWSAGLLPEDPSTVLSNPEHVPVPSDVLDLRVLDQAPVVLRRITIKNGSVFLQPATLPTYGHGSELVEVLNVNGDITVGPADSKSGQPLTQTRPISKNVASATVKGYSRSGGILRVRAQCDLDALKYIRPGDKVVDLNVAGEGIPASQIASFLNLPFRADEGKCSGDLAMQFPYKGESPIPEMHGVALLDRVALRFHPDPQTPGMSGVSGGLRFDDRTLFMDGPNGKLGTLPLTVVGSIDLLGEYNLLGYVRNVDVNNIIETFDLDKFVPVEGQIRGEARMTGLLEEPFVEGWAISVGKGKFDKVPVERAKAEFAWESQAGLLKFSEIQADVTGGGEIIGSGGLYFDMTKITPFDMSRPTHHQNSPKAKFWNPESPQSGELPPPPADEFDIDFEAPSRPYDSMLFTFSARDIPGSNLLEYYGGKHGAEARASAGLVGGEAVLAGYVKDANCRAVWRTVTQPPAVRLITGKTAVERLTAWDGEASHNDGYVYESANCELYPRESNATLDEIRDLFQRDTLQEPAKNPSVRNSTNFPGSDSLGGGEFQGALFIKLGDLPSARRIKMRTTVRNFDARRAAWGSQDLKKYLANTPLLETSLDSYFRGVLHQKAVHNPTNPRTPRNELVGAEGALAVKDLRVNKMGFSRTLAGSLEFGPDFLRMNLKQREPARPPSSSSAPSRSSTRSRIKRDVVRRRPSPSDSEISRIQDSEILENASRTLPDDEICISSSLEEPISLAMRRGRMELNTAVGNLSKKARFVKLSFRELSLDEILGGDGKGANGIPTGILGADFNLDLGDRRGEGRVSLKRSRYRDLLVDSFRGSLSWRNEYMHIQKSSAHVRRSEYALEGWYRMPSPVSAKGPAWELKISVPELEVSEITRFITAARRRRVHSKEDILRFHRTEELDIQALSSSIRAQSDTATDSSVARAPESEDTWAMPDLPFDGMMDWFEAYQQAANERMRREEMIPTKKVAANPLPGLLDLRGLLRGSLTMRYDSEVTGLTNEENSVLDDQKARLLLAILEPLGKFSFEFDVHGDSWELGPHSLGEVSAGGMFSNNKLQLYPCQVHGPDGFEFSATGSLSASGEVQGHALVMNASASVLNRYSRGNFRLDGKCSARLDIRGLIADPKLDGRVVWTDAVLNDKRVRDAHGDVRCRDGRCTLDLNARFGGRERHDGIQDFDVYKSLANDDGDASESDAGLAENVHTGPSRSSQEILLRGPAQSDPSRNRRLGEPIALSVSAPLRFYAVEYLRKTVPRKIWTEVEPLLAGAGNPEEDWISMDVDVRKYGLLLANVAFPSMGWVDGSSNIDLRVRGTLQEPIIVGRASIYDGQLWPSVLPSPIEGVKGELQFDANGAVTVRSLHGRCKGRTVSIGGSLPLSEKHRESTETIASQLIPARSTSSRAERRSLVEKRDTAACVLDLYSRGITLEVGDIMVDVKDQMAGHLSGRVIMKGSLLTPVFAGNVAISRGVIYLANPPLSPDKALKTFSTTGLDSRPALPGRDETASVVDERLPVSSPVPPPKVARMSAEGSRRGSAKLNSLKIILGKDLEVVYPYLMTFGASGTVTLNGSFTNPLPSGRINFPRGEINLLTSRMEIKRDIDNYARFEASDDLSNALDPIIRLALEDRDVVLEVKEARASKWAEQLSVVDKRGEQIDESAWVGIVRSRLEELQKELAAGTGLPNLAARYLFNLSSLRGKVGSMQWRLHPAMVTSMKNFSHATPQEDIGLGAEFEFGKVGLSLRVSPAGSRGGSLSLRPMDGVKLGLESDGPFRKGSIEIRIPRRFGRNGDDEDLEEHRIVIEAPDSKSRSDDDPSTRSSPRAQE